MTKKLILCALVATAITVAAIGATAIFASGKGTNVYAPPADGPIQGNFTLAQAVSFTNYALYNLGPTFEGLPLTAVNPGLDAPHPDPDYFEVDFVNFFYGDCLADDPAHPDVHGCAPPLQVQVWPACKRNPTTIWSEAVEAMHGPREAVTVRGVPAYFYSDATNLDVQAADVTIAIFGGNRDHIQRAANALVPVNTKAVDQMKSVPRVIEPPLPEPVAGVLTGELSCD